MARKLVFDTANLLFRVAAVNAGKSFGSPEEQAALALHVSFQSIYKYYKKFKPDQIAFTFEGIDNWRKTLTKSPDAIAGNIYKANRIKDASMEPYFQLMDSFREVMTLYSSAVILRQDLLEGDDCFAAYAQVNCEAGHEVIGVSGDRDFIQLYKLPGFKLINPDTGKERNQPGDKEYYEDIDYWLFLKCVRGDKGDYVFSAYPNVRETKIKRAYEDDFYRLEFMNTTWDIKDAEGNVAKSHTVGALFEENKILMDLFAQPEHIKELMVKTVHEAEANISKYSNFHFLKFLGTHHLQELALKIDTFTDMLSCNSRYQKTLLEETSLVELEPSPKKKVLVDF